jgi:hypothetical protein
MPTRSDKVSPALKHGGYSESNLLPGEDRDDFKKMQMGLIAELAPIGQLEEETVAAIAKLMWRRQNLARFEMGRLSHYMAEILRIAALKDDKTRDDELLAECKKTVEATTRSQSFLAEWQTKGDREVLEIAKTATLPLLMEELDVEERLDAMIDRLLKRLLFVRGLKSITPSIDAGSSGPSKRGSSPTRSFPRKNSIRSE